MSALTTDVREGHRYFSPEIHRVLQRTPVAQWNALAVLLDSESGTPKLYTRVGLAQWLRANDLGLVADEVARRKVVPGALLVLALTSEGPRLDVLFDPRRRRSA